MADITVTAADVRPLHPFLTARKRCGGSVNVGDSVYINSSGYVQQTSAGTDTIGTATTYGVVVAVNATGGGTVAASGDFCDVVIYGRVTGFSSLTANQLLWVSTSAGRIANDQAGGTYYNFCVGQTEDSTTILVRPCAENIAAQS